MASPSERRRPPALGTSCSLREKSMWPRPCRGSARQRPNDRVTGTPRGVGRSARAHPGNRVRASAASLSVCRTGPGSRPRMGEARERSGLALDGFRETSVIVRRWLGERACPRTAQVPSSRSPRWPAAALPRCSSPWWPRISVRDRPLLPDASVFRRPGVARRPRPETPSRPRGSGTSRVPRESVSRCRCPAGRSGRRRCHPGRVLADRE